ncbi:MAG: flagellar export protein FliJ [Gorillibacterium sp.]|nr:flagellar export protein FliJ [Gorillibacterium sp.]
MRFRYSFQKIVDLKSSEKTQAEWILSTAVHRLREEEASLSMLQGEKLDLQNQITDRAVNQTTVSELILFQNYLSHIDGRIVGKRTDIRSAEKHVSERREQLSVKMTEEKIWAKAREKAKTVHTAEELKKEQEVLDEIAVTRHKRSS